MWVDKVLTVADLHHGDHDEDTLDAIEEFGKDFKPTTVQLLGDNMEFSSINYFDRGKPKLLENRRLMMEYSFFNGWLDRADKIWKPKKKIFYIGNHEYRVDRLIETDPQYEGFIEVERNLNLKKRGYKVIDYNKTHTIGGITYMHGLYTNKYHAAKTVEVFHNDIVYGHSHTVQEFTHKRPNGKKPVSAKCIGSVQTYDMDWWLNKPSWQVHSFHIAYIWKGGFNDYIIKVNNGRFYYGGKLYGKPHKTHQRTVPNSTVG